MTASKFNVNGSLSGDPISIPGNMRTDTANISYRNLICNEGRGQILSLYHSTTGTWTYIDISFIVSYLVIFDSESFLFSLFLIHPDALTIFQGWLPNNYHCLICRPCLHELCLGITEKISDCLLCTRQMIQPLSWSKTAAKICLG